MPVVFLPNVGHSVFYDERNSSSRSSNYNDDDDASDDASLIFVHHATGAATDWRDQLDFFSSLPHHRPFHCIAYDRIGFGNSIPFAQEAAKAAAAKGNQDDAEVYSKILDELPLDYYERSLEELADLVTQLKLQRIILVGHSDGATISLLAASGQRSNMVSQQKGSISDARKFLQSKIAAVVAEAPHMWFDDRMLMQGFEQFKATTQMTEKFWRSTARDHLNSPENAQRVVRRWQSMWTPARFGSWDDRHCLPHIRCPLMVMHGNKDPFFPVDHSRYIAETVHRNTNNNNNSSSNGNHDTEFVIFNESGHTPHREQRTLYNETVLPFLLKHRYGRRTTRQAAATAATRTAAAAAAAKIITKIL